MMLLSSKGNDHISSDPTFFTSYDASNYVIGSIDLIGLWVQPVKDDSGEIIGSRVLTYLMGAPGGMIPNWVYNKYASLPVYLAMKGGRKYVEE